jgi:hypothetical protein
MVYVSDDGDIANAGIQQSVAFPVWCSYHFTMYLGVRSWYIRHHESREDSRGRLSGLAQLDWGCAETK